MQNKKRQQRLKTNFKPHQLNKVAEFGVIESTPNVAGINVPHFVSKMKLHYARIKTTLTQKYLVAETSLSDTTNIAVRHNEQVQDMQQVKINDQVYNIVDVSPDDEMYISYDFVTIRKVKKGGGERG